MSLTNNNLDNKSLHTLKLEKIELKEQIFKLNLRISEINKIIKIDNKSKRSLLQKEAIRKLIQFNKKKKNILK